LLRKKKGFIHSKTANASDTGGAVNCFPFTVNVCGEISQYQILFTFGGVFAVKVRLPSIKPIQILLRIVSLPQG